VGLVLKPMMSVQIVANHATEQCATQRISGPSGKGGEMKRYWKQKRPLNSEERVDALVAAGIILRKNGGKVLSQIEEAEIEAFKLGQKDCLCKSTPSPRESSMTRKEYEIPSDF
jgi:hypothetical protein